MAVTIENGHVMVSKGELLLLLGPDQGTFIDFLLTPNPLAMRLDKALQMTGFVDLESDMLRNPATGVIPMLVAAGVIQAETVVSIDSFIAGVKAAQVQVVVDGEAEPVAVAQHRWRLPNGVEQGSATQWFSNVSISSRRDGADWLVETDSIACTYPGAILEA